MHRETAMSHKPVTHSRPIPMPRQSGLLERNGRFYLNMRVPKDLRPLYGKKETIRKSLHTSDRGEAISLVRFEACKLDSDFQTKRRELKQLQNPSPLRSISDREAHDLVFRWFIDQEKLSEDWWDKEGSKFDEEDAALALDNLRTDEVVYSGGSKHYLAEDGSRDLDLFLKSKGLNCPKDSPAYQKLVPLFTKARLENVRRTMARVSHQTVSALEPLFRDVFAHTSPRAPKQIVTVEKLVERFLEYLRAAKRSDKTLRTYQIPCRLLREELGEKTSVESVTKERMEELYGLLRRAPSNVTKRYRGLRLKEAIELADKQGDTKRLSVKSLDNYRVNIEAIFNFAVEEEYITKNPAKGRTLRALMEGGVPPKPKVHFTVDEMNRLFRLPPFDLSEGAKVGLKPGKKMLAKGRAWVCLLSLFHGFRLNEVAQLYTEDVKKEDCIPFIEIRKEREDGSESDKRIKTKQSKRRVPIHPELLKMGFHLFVAQRKKDASRQRLFPDLPLGASGYFSDPFSKWFSGFKKKALGQECKATFHSFRHQFRDALREAGVSTEDAERLGGWEVGKHSAEREYGQGPSLKRLRQQIQKVKYPKLDLSHLYLGLSKFESNF